MTAKNQISAQSRTDLSEWLASLGYHWAGTQNEDSFLARLYNLRELPTTDSRRSQFPTAAEDIWQHRVNNQDWDDDWVFTDPRFNLLHCPDEQFLAFFAATVRPATQQDASISAEMVAAYNGVLVPFGWELVEQRRVGDNVYYVGRETAGVHDPETVIVAAPDVVDRAVLDQQLKRLRRDIETDPAAAIAHCKELLESQAKLVLRGFEVNYSDRDDLPALFGAATRALGIHADAVPEDSRASDALKGMLRNLQSVVKNVSEARNSMGTGHGRADASPAERRHARLVFNATVAVAEFVADTWAAHPGVG